jgi:hypothetical protein
MITRIKLIKTGKFVEKWIYKTPIQYGHENKTPHGRNIEAKTDEKILVKIATTRAKNKLRRLIIGNIYHYEERPKFLTLTIKENITDLNIANQDFRLFIKRLTYKLGYTARYVAVPEFQERGAVHYHVITFNMPYIQAKDIADIWKIGTIDIKEINRGNKAFKYIIKYVSPAYTDDRFKNKKRYFWSLENKSERHLNEQRNIERVPDNKYLINEYKYEVKGKDNKIINEAKKSEYLTL